MFGENFGEKCIIMHFLGSEKDRKKPLTQRRRGAEKRFEGEQRRETQRSDKRTKKPPAHLKVAPTISLFR
jgi:hypothetical protein